MLVDRSVQYLARRTFGYDASIPYVDRGMVFKLRGQPNDEKLVRLGYVEPWKGRDALVECNRCGQRFADLGALNQHGKLRHPDAPIDEGEMLERIEAFESKAAPLYMDQTAATKDAAAASHEVKRPRKFA
jgi:hypothetical protein